MTTETAEAIFPYRALPKVPVTACPVCGARHNPARAVLDRYGYPVHVARCAECTLQYLAERLTREGYARLYGSGAYRALVEAYCGTPPMTLAESERHYGSWIGQHLRSPLGQGGSLLDAGGSVGGLIPHLGLAPARVTVLDPCAGELAQVPAGYQTLQGWLEDPIPGTYDGVVCSQTLDHVTDPIAALRHLRAACPTGWLIADFACRPPTAIKIDHPLYWTPVAWERALRATAWHPREWLPQIALRGTPKRATLRHVVTVCR